MLTPHEEARAYRIWAVGKSVKWDCTLQEIADETGISATVVQRVCKARGWKTKGRFAIKERQFSTRHGVDQIMASPGLGQYEGKI